MATVDAIELETQVKDLYRHVAEQPHGAYHFETGRALAKRLGYPADLRPGERVMDLGSGSGMTFVAATLARLRRSQHRPGEPHQQRL
jgi:arsenite methyltransferase